MKKCLPTALITALAASPALAHGGAHLHPHGSEPFLLVGFLAVIGAIALGVFRRR